MRRVSFNCFGLRRLVLTALSLVGAMTGAGAEEVVLGHISSPTHPSSITVAKPLREGLQLAVQVANATGGISGNPLKLEMRDDNLDAKQMADLTAEYLANPKVVGLVGYLNTGGLTGLAKADAFGKGGVALVAPYQGNADIVGASNIYPFRSGYDTEVRALLKEIQATYKTSVLIVHQSVAFGPGLAKSAAEQATAMKLSVVGTAEIDGKPGGDLAGSVKRAVALVAEKRPQAVLLLAAGALASATVKAIRDPASVDTFRTPIYGMSFIPVDSLVAGVGKEKTHGIVLSQATPYPFAATTKLVMEYQQAMKTHAPTQSASYAHFEGYIAGKLATAALRRAGAQPTRQSLLRSLDGMGRYDLGGFFVDYSPAARRGWGGAELVIIDGEGKIRR